MTVNHLLGLSLPFYHLVYPTEHEEHLDLRVVAANRAADLSVRKRPDASFLSDHGKV